MQVSRGEGCVFNCLSSYIQLIHVQGGGSNLSIYHSRLLFMLLFFNTIQLRPSVQGNIQICQPEGEVVFPRAFTGENNIPRVNNCDVHRKCRQLLFYYTETLFTIMLDTINTYLCVFINFIFVFLTSGQDCNYGMQKRIHFRTDMEHNITSEQQ